MRDLFVDVFGYTLNPTVGFNLTTELRNIKDTKKADGGIIIDEKVVGVIELKGTNTTDLGKIEQQAFNYKNNQIGCIYVITSNFEKLRFYVEDTIHFQEFNLFDLSQEDFNLLYLFLNFDNLQNNVPKKIKDESVSQEDVITKKLYKDYSVFKRELFQNFVQQNPDHNQLELFKKTQKLLDRLLFLFFGEDRGLLPPNSVRQILEQWNKLNDLDEYVPLYNRFKKYFGYLNTGFKGKNHDVFAYNGGLFKPDEILDVIYIDDDLLYKHTLKLSEYDFASEVDVNILGHIFENSLNEIDEIKSQLEGKEVDKSKTKRKKDGVFYTPKYITKYIVENTVGKLCEEKKTEFGIVEEDYSNDKKRQQKTKENLLQKLDEYRKWLLQITIVDPACGSGAFLNEALNFLIEEHRYIDEMESKLTGSSISFSYHSESILENNLFGVDLNEESVEIAKLSLWLRTAEPNRKLNNLNNNIKCGNSLIDDREVAGDKAFSWEKEFPQVFEKGGFDVVIGNPPYGVKFSDQEKKYLGNFDVLVPDFEIYIFFISLHKKILRKGGVLSYIFPNTFLSIMYGQKYREEIFSTTVVYEIVDLSTDVTFVDANVRTCIFSFSKNDNDYQCVLSRLNNKEFSFIEVCSRSQLIENSENILSLFSQNSEEKKIITKVLKFPKLKSFLTVSQGYIPYRRSDLIKKYGEEEGNKIVDNRLWHSTMKFDETWKREILGKDLKRYHYEISDGFIKYGKDVASYVDPKFFETERIIVREITSDKLYCSIIEEEAYNNPSIINIIDEQNVLNLRYVLSLLNSSLIGWFHKKMSPKANKGLFPKILINDIRNLPLIDLEKQDQQTYVLKSNEMISLNKDLHEVSNRFQRTLTRKFEGISLSKKMQDWYSLSYPEFIKELSKQKIKLSLSEEAEWEDYFSQEKQKALDIKNTIDATDKEIDQMVYELYGLTEEEIEIVENS
ncbi:Eco57I restriction-modification methylase domain-containing protein [Chryseobacterium sp. MFBS3-17]|uniref:Eco57I restriction-modification methylase domain-containing protein n=1 Tax=Chryseobacterium sp. MFBS3-17 TaxID=2886689 RepID=UPI00293E7D33|nr:N-6 DNA methylase [Chryseobacterium sp. MFBS3-17]